MDGLVLMFPHVRRRDMERRLRAIVEAHHRSIFLDERIEEFVEELAYENETLASLEGKPVLVQLSPGMVPQLGMFERRVTTRVSDTDRVTSAKVVFPWGVAFVRVEDVLPLPEVADGEWEERLAHRHDGGGGGRGGGNDDDDDDDDDDQEEEIHLHDALSDYRATMEAEDEALARELHRRLNMAHEVMSAPRYGLPTHKFVPTEEAKLCLICQYELVEGEDVRVFPCMHLFHEACSDQWLSRSHGQSCPVCKTALVHA